MVRGETYRLFKTVKWLPIQHDLENKSKLHRHYHTDSIEVRTMGGMTIYRFTSGHGGQVGHSEEAVLRMEGNRIAFQIQLEKENTKMTKNKH